MPCIYCLKSTEERCPRAHIFPESIFGDHDELVLANRQVCGACNNGFAHLESKFKDRLGFIPMMVGMGKNKRGRPTTINAPGMRGTRDPRNPLISLNLGKRPWITAEGVHVRPAVNLGERITFSHGERGPGGYRFRFVQEMRVDDVLIRILTKIAFETVCLLRGAEYCADLRWHRLRAFILRSEGKRAYFMPKTLSMPTAANGGVSVPVGISLLPVRVRTDRDWMEEWLAAVRVGPSFLLDISPENLVLPTLLEAMPTQARDAGFLKTCEGKPTVQAA
ncbi:MAG TPA: hypothetical protein VL332_02065 [Candidatus Saccharimonadaceae bacterium]|nr:hypothetical protein [Candidatus Saccharimonadaceae bacterium]